MWQLLAEMKLEDVFRSTHDSMDEGPGSGRLIILILGAAIMVGVLVALQYRRKRQALPRAVNHHGKLVKELMKPVGLKPAEMSKLKEVAEEQGLGDPLVLLLCPSLLAKAAQDRSPEDKKVLTGLVKRMSDQH